MQQFDRTYDKIANQRVVRVVDDEIAGLIHEKKRDVEHAGRLHEQTGVVANAFDVVADDEQEREEDERRDQLEHGAEQIALEYDQILPSQDDYLTRQTCDSHLFAHRCC